MKVAVVTPYFDEPLEILERCHASVLAQTHGATHILVADGHPRRDVQGWDAQHLTLPQSHADGGDTPRAIAAISALNQGFDAFAFLDADNWYGPEHIASCVEVCSRKGAHVAFAARTIVLSTGQQCPFDDRDAVEQRHVDTSCFFVTRQAAFLLPLWAMIDPKVWQACDRIMLAAIQTRDVPHAWTGKRTVYYNSNWGLHFKAMGLPPPADEHQIDWKGVAARYDVECIERRFGFNPGVDLMNGNDHAVEDPSERANIFNRLAVWPESVDSFVLNELRPAQPPVSRGRRSHAGIGGAVAAI